MATFAASLRAIGDVRSLPATVELANGHLSIVAGSTEIGSWSITEIHLEQIPTGYRMSAEGEQILLEIKDLDSFTAELKSDTKRRLGLRLKREDKKRQSKPATPPPVAVPRPNAAERQRPGPVGATSDRTSTASGTVAPKGRETKPGIGTRVLDSIDDLLIRAKKRFGAYLPDFMFSRAIFFMAVAALAVMVLLPDLFSVLLLVAGALIVLFGAVVYSDSVLASRWLPGRATPQQALILGLGVLVVGVVVGVIAK